MTIAESASFDRREFPMTDSNFKLIQKIAYSKTGISLSDHKKNMIYGRLSRRLSALNLTNFDQYCSLINQKHSPELVDFINSITTNLTSIFRESHHFDYLENVLFPRLLQKNKESRRLRIWSAGCSTGEEPYSIAMVLNKFSEFRNWNAKILATDLDSNVVRHCKEGIYSIERIEEIKPEYKKYFSINADGVNVTVSQEIKQWITFKQLNLMNEWPMKGPFDLIFCRNVVIYFDQPTQKKLFARYADLLSDKGVLCIGHSESLHNVSDRFVSLGKTIYEKGESA